MSKNDDGMDPAGFGKPPRKYRFRKGQSGNPKGRPRKTVAPPPPEDLSESKLEAILRRILSRKYTVKDGTGSKTITGLEAIIQAQFQSAAKGNPHAMRLFMEAAGELERRDNARREAEARAAREHFDLIVRWKGVREKAWAAAVSEGREPEKVWPHPDDILIDEAAQTYWIRGPRAPKQVPFYEYLKSLRDLHLCKAALAAVTETTVDGFDCSLHVVVALTHDLELPQRWQIKGKPADAMFSLAVMGERWLARRLDKLEAEVLCQHKLAYPSGEKIKLDRKLRRFFKPLLPRMKLRSIAELERQMEQASGNPPLLATFYGVERSTISAAA